MKRWGQRVDVLSRAPTAATTGTIRSVDKTIDLLTVLAREPQGLPLAAIARRLDARPSTVHHLLATLLRRGFVAQDALTRTYRIGFGLVGVVHDFLSGVDLHAAGFGPVRKLADLTGETAYLLVPDGNDQVPIIKITGWQPVQSLDLPRTLGALHATASGKVLLAYLPKECLPPFLGSPPLRQFTPKTVPDLAALRAELEHIRQVGYALDRGELFDNVQSIAAPVFGQAKECVATVSVAFPRERAERLGDLTPLVVNVAVEVSQNVRGMRAGSVRTGATGPAETR